MFSLNRLHSIETHAVIRRIRRSDNLDLVGLRTPFLTWLLIAIGVKRYRYWTQSYWLCELENMTSRAGSPYAVTALYGRVREHQRRQTRAILRIAPLAKAIANVAERHVLNRADVSQLIVAAKKPIQGSALFVSRAP